MSKSTKTSKNYTKPSKPHVQQSLLPLQKLLYYQAADGLANNSLVRDMPKVIVDLDVVTIARWYEKRDPRLTSSQKFMKRVERGEFSLEVPDTFLEILRLWDHGELAKRIKSWYEANAKLIIPSGKAIKSIATKTRLNEETLIEKFASEADMKKEDAFLVLIGASSRTAYIVTWNKTHLRDKREKIEQIGKRLGLKIPKIVFPTEI